MSGRTPPPKGRENVETMPVPKKREVHHKHGKGTGHAQTGTVRIIGPGDEPNDARVVSRAGVSAFKNGSVRTQSADLDNRGGK